ESERRQLRAPSRLRGCQWIRVRRGDGPRGEASLTRTPCGRGPARISFCRLPWQLRPGAMPRRPLLWAFRSQPFGRNPRSSRFHNVSDVPESSNSKRSPKAKNFYHQGAKTRRIAKYFITNGKLLTIQSFPSAPLPLAP